MPDLDICPNCGASWEKSYCSTCGERRLKEYDLGLLSYLKNLFGELTSVDSRIWLTAKTLLLKPGTLSVDYFLGKRKSYILPFRLFLLCNLVYFVFQPYSGYNGFNTTLSSHEQRQSYSKPFNIAGWVAGHLEAEGLERAPYEKAFNERTEIFARSLIIVIVPIQAVFFMLLWGRSRPHFLEHIIFSLHFMAWMLFYYMTMFLNVYTFIFYYGVLLIPGVSDFQGFFIEVLPIFFLGFYVYYAQRRFVDEPKWRTIIKSILMTFLVFISTLIYRFILFLAVFYTL